MAKHQIDTGKADKTINTNNVWDRIVALEEKVPNDVVEQLDGLTASLTESASIDANLVVTVGTGGNYSTINDAISYLSKRKLKYASTGLKAEVKLLSGFIMQEQVFVEGLDLGWIRITSVDPVVTIDRASLSRTVISLPSYDDRTIGITSNGAFAGLNNAVLPVIATLFDMNTTGVDSSVKDGFCVMNNSKLVIEKGCGCRNASGRGIYVGQGSIVAAAGAIITGAKSNGISCFRQSFIYFRGGDASNALYYGVYADSNSKVEAITAKFMNCGGTAVYADSASMISCPSVDVTGAGAVGISASGASTIDAREAVVNNCGQRGVSASGNASINVDNSSVLNSGTDGIYATSNAKINANNCTVTGSTGKGVYATYGGIINASNTNAQKGASPVTDDIRAISGGIIFATGATGGIGGVSAPNVLSNNGIIFNGEPIVDGTTFGTVQTFTPTGDWAGSLTYSKTSSGFIWLRGTLTAGTTLTPGTNIGSLVGGYRPPNTMPIQSIHGTNNTQYGFHISSSGGFYLSDTLVAGNYNINVLYKSA